MRLIDKDELIDAVEGAINVLELHGVSRIFTSVPLAIIIAAPTIDAAPVVHGKWEVSMSPFWDAKCSECGFRTKTDWKWRYCPECGAKMDGGGRDGEFS